MADFFSPGVPASIRLDEIEWGGVVVNGIPPLVYPKTIPAAEARYLRDNHIVFGIAVNGRARAYPKRILAWHELARDRVGGVELTVVYCTLCGTVIPYDSVAGGRLRVFGTSGLLYRSNKLMFDEETKSLWSTLDGRPVVGPLVGSDAVLTSRAAVTTTWGEWRRRHPQTDVLSLDTGHERDYSEGAAYRGLLLDRSVDVLGADNRYAAEQQGGSAGHAAADRRRPTRSRSRSPRSSWCGAPSTRRASPTVMSSSSRAAPAPTAPTTRRGERSSVCCRTTACWTIRTSAWQVTEDALVAADGLPPRPRIAAQRAFWFGWHAQFPDTILIK